MKILTAVAILGCVIAVARAGDSAAAIEAYRPITPAEPGDAITLTGHDLTIEQLAAIARQGQPVEISPEVSGHEADARNLLLQGAAEGLSIPGFTPGGADDGGRVLASFQNGAAPPGAPEIPDEAMVRATMAVRANTLIYQPVTAPIQQMLLDFLNDRITPVVTQPTESAGGAQSPMANIAAAMVGHGDVYYRGMRISAARALSLAGLTPVAPADFDDHALIDTGAFDIARAALLAADGRQFLEWADLAYAMDLEGAGASVAPLSVPAQADRPFVWLTWDAARILAILKDSDLLKGEGAAAPNPYPEMFRLSPTRQGAAWQQWGALRDAVLVALNSSDQSPAIRPGLSPRESSELSTPQMMKYFVRGGKLNGGKRGFIVPTANRDPYPLARVAETFIGALNDLNAAIALRTPGLPPLPGKAAGLDDTLEPFYRLLAADIAHGATMIDKRAAENPDLNFGDPLTTLRTDFRKTVASGLPPDTNAAAIFLQSHAPSLYFADGEPPPGTDAGIPLAQEKIRR